MATDVARHLTTTGGETHQGHVLQVERVDHRRQVIGVVIHVVAFPGLAGPAMAAAVMGDHAIALGCEKQHLRFPAVGTQRPAVAEGHHRAVLRAPVLVVELHAIGGSDGVGCMCGNSGAAGLRRLCGLGGECGLQRDGQQRHGEGTCDRIHGMGLLFERVAVRLSRR